MTSLENRAAEEHLLRRIRGEYLEMPGLHLTQAQAQRLWALDAATCAKVLESLIAAGFLRCGPDGQYGRISDITVDLPRVRMARADGHGSVKHARGH